MTARSAITLVGDGIENPANAQTMMDAAGMFAGECRFRDRQGLSAGWQEGIPAGRGERPNIFLTYEELAQGYSPIVAFDNVERAADVYGFKLRGGPRAAVVLGNERRGIGRDILAIADHRVHIPMFARGTRGINCLNVAAASAIALYYLSRGGGAKLQVTSHPDKRRPELMMVGGYSHVELGSAIRSAGALGWQRVVLEDRMGVWFGARRSVQAEGRAAARRHRNPIHLVPTAHDSRYAFAEVCVLTSKRTEKSVSIHRANLARGPRQLLVIPDESAVTIEDEDWHHLGKQVKCVHLDLPQDRFVYHYRLIASIALAEAARQVGQKAARPDAPRPARPEPFYDNALNVLFEQAGQTVFLEDLEGY